jgi:hypothetical protein
LDRARVGEAEGAALGAEISRDRIELRPIAAG